MRPLSELAAELGRELAREQIGEPLGQPGDVAVREEGLEQLAGFAGHVLVDAPESLREAADVVHPVAVVPDVLDDLGDRACGRCGRLGGDWRRVPEPRDERAAEAVEQPHVRLDVHDVVIDEEALADGPLVFVR